MVSEGIDCGSRLGWLSSRRGAAELSCFCCPGWDGVFLLCVLVHVVACYLGLICACRLFWCFRGRIGHGVMCDAGGMGAKGNRRRN